MVHFNPNYDNFEVGENWAHKSLAKHAADPRPSSTPRSNSKTPRLTTRSGTPRRCRWSTTGWMHNYLRMYWAKKILEWTHIAGPGSPDCRPPQRQVRARRPRPQRLRGHRLVDRRQSSIARGSSGRSSGRSATCRAPAPARNSTARNTLSRICSRGCSGKSERQNQTVARIHQNRHRAVIHQLHIHHFLKAAGFARQPRRAHPRHEIFVQRPAPSPDAPRRQTRAAAPCARRHTA